MYDKLISFFDKLVGKLWRFTDNTGNIIGENKKIKLVLFIAVFCFFVSIIFIFNRETPMQWDDFKLAFIWTEEVVLDEAGKMNEPTTRIASFYDILASQYNHYYTWGGRTVVHIIAQFLIFINPLIADILNSLVYLLFSFLIYYHIKGNTKHSISTFIMANLLIWFLQPVFGETMLWLTGSANYLWGTSIVLLFMLPFRLFENKYSKYTIPKCIVMFLFGVIAGWTNENTVGASIIIIFLFLLYYRSKKWKIPAWAIIGLTGMIIGYIIMLKAPGNFNRAELRAAGMSISPFNLSYRFLTSTQLLFQYLGIINLLSFILFLICKRYSTNDAAFKRIKFLAIVYFLGTLTAVYAMLLSPTFPPRAWFGAITFNIISFGILFHNLNLSLVFIRQIKTGIVALGIILFGFTLYDGLRDVFNVNNAWKEREITIKKQKEINNKVTLYWVHGRTKFTLSDPPFLPGVIKLYYEVEVEMK